MVKIMNYFFGNCDTTELAKKFSTPLYVMDETAIINNIRKLKGSFDDKYDNAKTFYASKAFLTKDMLKIAMEENIGVDVASGGELYLARAMNYPPDDIMYHGNGKTIQEIEEGIDYNVGRFVVDSLDEILMLDKIAEQKNKLQKIIIRISPGVDSDTHKYIQTAGKDSKFGVPLQKVHEIVEKTLSLENVKLMGFHFHIGSQLFNNNAHLKATEITLNLIKDFKEKFNFDTLDLDLGGGFGVKYVEGDDEKEPSYFLDPMVELIKKFTTENNLVLPHLYIEPGRYVVANAGITLYTIGSIKEIPNIRTYASIDGGMTDNMRVALYQAKYEAVIANKLDDEKTQKVTIAGKCCESSDILIKDLEVPELEWGDILAVKTTGAYHHSLANNYNKNALPAVVMLKDGVARLSVERQSYEDIYKNQL